VNGPMCGTSTACASWCVTRTVHPHLAGQTSHLDFPCPNPYNRFWRSLPRADSPSSSRARRNTTPRILNRVCQHSQIYAAGPIASPVD